MKTSQLFQQFYLYDTQLTLCLTTILGLEQVKLSCGRLGYLHDTAKGILVLAGTF